MKRQGRRLDELHPAVLPKACECRRPQQPLFGRRKKETVRAVSRRPVRPRRWRNDATVVGASSCMTRSRSPISIPSSSVLVATTTQSALSRNSRSVRRRSTALGELCDTNVRMPRLPKAVASSSVFDLLSQKTSRFSPPWSREITCAALATVPTWSMTTSVACGSATSTSMTCWLPTHGPQAIRAPLHHSRWWPTTRFAGALAARAARHERLRKGDATLGRLQQTRGPRRR